MEKCPKCGSPEVTVKYVKAESLITASSYVRVENEFVTAAEYDFHYQLTAKKEHLAKRCACGHLWRENIPGVEAAADAPLAFAVVRGEDNPHSCIFDDQAPCLACALIEVMGEGRRDEALELAVRLAESQIGRFPQLQPDAAPVPEGFAPRPGVLVGCGKASCADCYAPLKTSAAGGRS